jgi:hypothetical protein
MKTFTLTGFASFLATLPLEIEHADHRALEKAARIVEEEAKDIIGTYRYGWPQLAQSTQEDRVSKGFPANEPLLRTHAMRDSIEHVSDHKEACIGSNLDRAVFQELGTVKIPPRSFLAGALQHKADEVVGVIGREIVGALIGEVVVGENVLLRKP